MVWLESSTMNFGPEYPKINGIYKRNTRGIIIPGDFACEEFGYLLDVQWTWTEKIDGTNIRLHWDGQNVSIGGRTDKAQIPAVLLANMDEAGFFDVDRWAKAFPDSSDVTLYGEGYGAGIQKGGGNYRENPSFILFDALIDGWWLFRSQLTEVADKMEMDLVPTVVDSVTQRTYTLWDAITAVKGGWLQSAWDSVQIEGIVGRPYHLLRNRRGDLITTKIKGKDFTDYDEYYKKEHDEG